MDFTPSSYQQKILDCFTSTNENILVNALAGSGKSSTICLLTEHIDKSSIYIAFNASVVDEFKKKIKNPKVKVMTMHSLAYSIMRYNTEQENKLDEKSKGFGRQRNKKEVLLDNFKPYKILDDELTKRYGRYMDFSRRVFYKDQYVSLYNLCCLTMTNMGSLTEVDKLINDHTLFESYGEEDYPKPPIKEIAETLKVLDTKSKQQFDLDGRISFTDMLYITYWKLKNKEWEVPYWAQYTNVMVDEAQDLSKLQLSFLPFIKRYNGRYVFIGDHHQCQPAGTKISLIDGTIKNIEDLEYGDRVVEYAISRGGFMVSERYGRGENGLRVDNSFRPILNGKVDTGEFKGIKSVGSPKVYYEVLDKQRFYVDHLISIETQDGKKSSYTSNHNCLVKFNREKTEEAVCLYLMERKDGLFRIGIVHLYSSQSTLGIKARARSEGFDRCWILNIYDTQKDAWVAEQTYSLKYQIPQIIFQMDKIFYNEEDIKTIYSGTGEIRSHAIALLTEFGRDINYPLWTKDNINRHTARDHCFITQSCNIIPNYMDALVFNGEENLKCRKNQSWGHYQAIYTPIIKVEHKYGHFPVYGITTSVYHTYVADGIATHNSIYGFAGADTQSFKHISSMFAPVTSFDLPVCYRCAKSHLDRVNKLFDIPIKPRPNAPDGFVKKIEKDEIKNFAQPGDLVISRKNKWLAECVLSLAKAGIPVYMEDKAMVDDIRKIITKSKCTSIRGLKTHLEKMIVSYHEKIKKLAKTKAESVEDNEKKVEEVADTSSKIDNINFLDAILKSYVASGKSLSTSTDIFTTYIIKLLNTIPSPDCVRICSVHKAKGLEAENVFVLNEGKIAYDFRQSKEQNIQEKNLSYISMTRAKNGLYLVKEPTKANTPKKGESLNTGSYFLPDLDSSEQKIKNAIVNETFRRTMYGEAKNLRKDIQL